MYRALVSVNIAVVSVYMALLALFFLFWGVPCQHRTSCAWCSQEKEGFWQ